MTEYFRDKKNILTQLLGSRGSFMAGTGAQKRKKCGFQKDKEWVAKFFGLPSFWTSNVDNVKEGFFYSLRNVSAWKRDFQKDAKYIETLVWINRKRCGSFCILNTVYEVVNKNMQLERQCLWVWLFTKPFWAQRSLRRNFMGSTRDNCTNKVSS